jgi:hypothetical protein
MSERLGTGAAPHGVPQAWQSRRSGGIPSSVDDPTVSWQGREDRSVALLVYLPPFSLGSGHQPARKDHGSSGLG